MKRLFQQCCHEQDSVFAQYGTLKIEKHVRIRNKVQGWPHNTWVWSTYFILKLIFHATPSLGTLLAPFPQIFQPKSVFHRDYLPPPGYPMYVSELKWAEIEGRAVVMEKDCINGFVGGMRADGSNVVVNWIKDNGLKEVWLGWAGAGVGRF